MKKSSRLVFALVSVFLVLSFLACSAPVQEQPPAAPAATSAPTVEPAAPEEASLFTPGTYTAVAKGHNEDFEVTVTFSEDKIEDIVVGENYETGYIGDKSLTAIKDLILANQTTKIDVVSGATVTSGAMLAAVRDAIKQAGADANALPEANIAAVPVKDEKTQVVVVGSGTAGLSAAVEANEQGLDVILVEQLGILGGSSGRAGYFMGGGTQLQKDNGIEYSKEEFVKYYSDVEVSGTGGGNRSEINQDLFQKATAVRISEMAGDNVDWLQELGVKLTVRSTNQFYGDGGRVGPFFVQGMNDVLDKRNIDYRLNTRAEEIIMEGGRSTGVRVTGPDGGSYTISADAVIIATGGYNGNNELVTKFNPKYSGYPTDVSRGADGSGLLMLEKAGGVLFCMDQANYHSFTIMWRGASRNAASVITNGAIAVNKEGRRFVNEGTYYDESCCDAILKQTGGVCYIIMDQSVADIVLELGDNHLANHITMYEVADTAEELAAKLGIDAAAMKETLETYKASVASGTDEAFGRAASSMKATFEKGPFYGAEAKPELHTDHGGIIVDIDNKVLDKDGNAIAGLYAVGEVAATHVLGAATNTAALAHGRIAARSAKELIK